MLIPCPNCSEMFHDSGKHVGIHTNTGKLECPKTVWPTGKNPVLNVLRETFDKGDAWGSNINFLFALCDIATKYEVSIPADLHYVASPFGGDEEAYEFKSLEALMIEGEYIYRALTLEEFRKHVGHALKVCARYDSLLRLAGENY